MASFHFFCRDLQKQCSYLLDDVAIPSIFAWQLCFRSGHLLFPNKIFSLMNADKKRTNNNNRYYCIADLSMTTSGHSHNHLITVKRDVKILSFNSYLLGHNMYQVRILSYCFPISQRHLKKWVKVNKSSASFCSTKVYPQPYFHSEHSGWL